jgi:2Fe-2S ferredoxin
MPKVVFVEHDGTQHDLEATDGMSLLEVARDNDVEGITGECGGCLSCATCHVYVDEAWLPKLTPPSAEEDGMLDGTYCDREPNSRLACQIHVSPELDGIVLRLPEQQT